MRDTMTPATKRFVENFSRIRATHSPAIPCVGLAAAVLVETASQVEAAKARALAQLPEESPPEVAPREAMEIPWPSLLSVAFWGITGAVVALSACALW